MSPKKFILLQLENSLRAYCEPNVRIIATQFLEEVNLTNGFFSVFQEQSDETMVLIVEFIFVKDSQIGDFTIEFRAKDHLLDGMRFYRSILEQLDVDMNFDIEAQIPSELRHLLPTQPELIGRP